MTGHTPDIPLDNATELIILEATALWGQDYPDRNQEIIQQAAAYMVSIANNLPDTETEPGFYQ